MKKINFKKLLPHLVALLVFVIISIIYFYPALQGYKLKQGDIQHHKGMSHEINKHKADFGEQSLWAGNMFGGMPSYQISAVEYSGNILVFFFKLMRLFFAQPISALIAYMIGFYILLMCLKIDPWLAVVGSIAFAFSSYFLIILEAGHNSKAFAIAFVPPMLGSFIVALRGKRWWGFILIAIFLGLELYANHLQITYYSIFLVLAIGIAELIRANKERNLPDFFQRAGIILFAVVLAVLLNIGNLLTTYEYSKLSTRGESELSITPNGNKLGEQSSGLDAAYITSWSYGIDETFSLFLPNAKGGASGSPLADQEEVERLRKENPAFFNVLATEYQKFQHPLNSYWGNQPFTSGPVYVGVLIFFLAILSIIFIRTPLVIALSLCLLLSILLAWGKNLMSFTNIFLDFVPLYNKFRAVSMILVLAELILPLFAVLFIDKLLKDKAFYEENKKRLKYVLLGITLLLAFLYISPQTFVDFTSQQEEQMFSQRLQSGAQNAGMIESSRSQIIDYREGIFRSDVLNALKYLLLGALVILLFIHNKIKSKIFILLIGGIVLIDLWSMDKEFIHNKKSANRAEGKYQKWEEKESKRYPYIADPADKQIMANEIKAKPSVQEEINQKLNEVKAENKRLNIREIEDIQYSQLMRNTHYRVLNTSTPLDRDSRTAYFHKSLGGYHGAKLERYQELVDFELGIEHYQLAEAFRQGGLNYVRQILSQMNVTNMLNAKYIIGNFQGQRQAIINNSALGNAWFVNKLRVVENADSAILALKALNPATTAVVIKDNWKDFEGLSNNYTKTNSNIELVSYLPDELVYRYQTSQKSFAVFSEIYYEKGWKAYLNGEYIDHLRVNFVLRGLELPSGSGELVFKFEPKSYALASKLTWFASILLILAIGAVIYKEWKKEEVT